MKTLAVLTSGGDAPGMNAAVRAITRVGHARGVTVMGVEDGYEGLVDGRLRALLPQDVDPHLGRGGTCLGSARSKRFTTPEGRAQAAQKLAKAGVEGLIVIGGNGSLTGAHLLAREHGVKVMGIPGSIDNAIGCTSTAIGVDTALNTIVEACDRISDTARAHRRAFVVEVMGRHSGYLAMASAVAAGADAVLFRESGKAREALLQQVADVVRRGFAAGKRRVLIIKAEGVELPATQFVADVEALVQDELAGAEIRATVLGHVVRGGSPTYQDRMVAGRFGFAALNALMEGHTDEMVAWTPNATKGGIATADPFVSRFPLSVVLEETQALLDGSSPTTKRRVQMMEAVEGVLAL